MPKKQQNGEKVSTYGENELDLKHNGVHICKDISQFLSQNKFDAMFTSNRFEKPLIFRLELGSSKFFRLMVAIISFTIFIFMNGNLIARVGIGTTTPYPGSILDIVSTDKGILIPRIENTAVTSPVEGMLIYQPSTDQFLFYDGASWQAMGSGLQTLIDGDGDTKVTVEQSPDEYSALYSNISGANNIANGLFSLYCNNGRTDNIANGLYSLPSNTLGSHNIANGFRSAKPTHSKSLDSNYPA